MFASVMLLMPAADVSFVEGDVRTGQSHSLQVPTRTVRLRREAVCRR